MSQGVLSESTPVHTRIVNIGVAGRVVHGRPAFNQRKRSFTSRLDLVSPFWLNLANVFLRLAGRSPVVSMITKLIQDIVCITVCFSVYIFV